MVHMATVLLLMVVVTVGVICTCDAALPKKERVSKAKTRHSKGDSLDPSPRAAADDKKVLLCYYYIYIFYISYISSLYITILAISTSFTTGTGMA